jgi:hypothetical protein
MPGDLGKVLRDSGERLGDLGKGLGDSGKRLGDPGETSDII